MILKAKVHSVKVPDQDGIKLLLKGDAQRYMPAIGRRPEKDSIRVLKNALRHQGLESI